MAAAYHAAPESLAHAIPGWFDTGDVVTMDADGYVAIVDRTKDMIVTGGFNVFPREVEDVVAACAGVLECCAIGLPDEHSGEVVKVFVVSRDATLTADAVIAHCRTQLTAYKIPRHVEFRSELPKTNVGKILRRALKEEAAAARKQ